MVPNWDSERDLHERVLANRFHFFLVFFSLVIAGSLAAKEQLFLDIVLGIGAVISILIALTIIRIQAKTDFVISKLHENKDHAATIVHEEVSTLECICPRKWIGYFIPPVCVVTLITGFILAILGILEVPG